MFPIHFCVLLFVPIVAFRQDDYIILFAPLAVFVGAILNMYVTHVNGKMPVKMYPKIAEAVHGRPHEYQPMTEATRFAWACDRIPISFGTMPFRVISVGDVLVYSGCAILWGYIAMLVVRFNSQ